MAMSDLVLDLPWPPTLSGYYENAKREVRFGPQAGKKYIGRQISADGIAYRAEVAYLVRAGHRAPPRLGGPLRVVELCFPPSRQRYDVDNLQKCLLDALTRAGVYQDDSLICDLRAIKFNPTPKGRLVLHISRFDPAEAEVIARAVWPSFKGETNPELAL